MLKPRVFTYFPAFSLLPNNVESIAEEEAGEEQDEKQTIYKVTTAASSNDFISMNIIIFN
jgi:hypothetical protein